MEMLEARTPEVLKVLLDKAVEGDMQAIKVVMDRVLPIATLQVIELAEQIEELKEDLLCQPINH